MRQGVIVFVGFVLAFPGSAQMRIQAGNSEIPIRFSGTVDAGLGLIAGDEGSSVARIFVSGFSADGQPASVKFKFTGFSPASSNAPSANFLVVSPFEGTTPAVVSIGVNENALATLNPTGYGVLVNFSTVDQTPASTSSQAVILTLAAPPIPVIASVLNSASLQASISPGEIVSIFGTNLAPPLLSLTYDLTGLFPTTLGDGTINGNTTVRINGIPAPLLYVSPNQINAAVPYGAAGQGSANVVVTRHGKSSATVSMPIVNTAPAIFTVSQSGSGPGAILNYDNRGLPAGVNSAANPVAKGAAIVMFGTGAGPWSATAVNTLLPPVPLDGSIVLSSNGPRFQPAASVSVTIGGQPATLIYAGAELYKVSGTLQINAIVPTNISSGQQPIVVKIGDNDNSQQNATVFVQ